MEKIFALIKDGSVENIIVADENFVALIAPKWNFIIRIDEISPRPEIGWAYQNGEFINPNVPEEE